MCETAAATRQPLNQLATSVLFQIYLSPVYIGVILSNRNAEQSSIPVTEAFIPAKPASPLLRSSGGSITLKYPENGLIGFPVAPLMFAVMEIIVRAISKFLALKAKMTNTFLYRPGFSKAFVMLLLVAQTALFVPGVRGVASARVVLSQVSQPAATLICPTSTSAPSGGKNTLQFPMGRYGNGPMARRGMMFGAHTSGSNLRRTEIGEKAQEAVIFPVDCAITSNIIDDDRFTQFAMLSPFTSKYYGTRFYMMGATCNCKNHNELNFSIGKHALRIKNEVSTTLWMATYISRRFSEICLKFVNFAWFGYDHASSNLSFSPSLRFIPDRFNDVFCINTLVHAINSGPLLAQHLDDSNRLETAWTVPIPLVAVKHNGIIFQAPVACVPPYVFIGTSEMSIMASTSTVIFTISPSDRIAAKANDTLAMKFFPVTSAILPATITLMYSSIAASIAPVVSKGASNIPGLNIACGAPSSKAVVLTTSGAAIHAVTAAFTMQKPASSGSNLDFLTVIGLGLLVTALCALFISLPLVAVQLNATANLTVRVFHFCLLRLRLQHAAHIEYICSK